MRYAINPSIIQCSSSSIVASYVQIKFPWLADPYGSG